MAIKKGINPKLITWSVPSMPKFVAKNGPLEFLFKLWKKESQTFSLQFGYFYLKITR